MNQVTLSDENPPHGSTLNNFSPHQMCFQLRESETSARRKSNANRNQELKSFISDMDLA